MTADREFHVWETKPREMYRLRVLYAISTHRTDRTSDVYNAYKLLADALTNG
jgi:hypothetical protein